MTKKTKSSWDQNVDLNEHTESEKWAFERKSAEYETNDRIAKHDNTFKVFWMFMATGVSFSIFATAINEVATIGPRYQNILIAAIMFIFWLQMMGKLISIISGVVAIRIAIIFPLLKIPFSVSKNRIYKYVRYAVNSAIILLIHFAILIAVQNITTYTVPPISDKNTKLPNT